MKIKKLNLPEKPDCILKKQGNFLGKYFCHFMSLYGQTFLKKSHIFEEGGAHLRIFFWHLLMNLKNKYLFKKIMIICYTVP